MTHPLNRWEIPPVLDDGSLALLKQIREDEAMLQQTIGWLYRDILIDRINENRIKFFRLTGLRA